MIQGVGRLPDVPEVDVVAARRRLTSGDVTLVDVREVEEFDQAHIPEAVNIPLGEIVSRAGQLKDKREILIYCQTGVRSAFAVDMLRKAGFETATNVSGGIVAWSQAGLPVTFGSS